MSNELSGQVALVTGGASGIGRASVMALLQAGAGVAVLDRDAAGVTATVEQAQAAGGRALALTVDLADTSQISVTVERVIQELGRIDILVNCAGVTGRFQSVLEMEEDNWDFVQAVNLKAPMLLMQHVAKTHDWAGRWRPHGEYQFEFCVSRPQLSYRLCQLKSCAGAAHAECRG